MSNRMPRPLPHPLGAIAVVGVLAAVLSGCQQTVGPPTLPTSELSDRVWPSTEDSVDPDLVAEHAARLVSRYLSTTDAITQEGGENPGRMAALTTHSWLATEEAAFAHYRTHGLRTVGDTEFDSLIVQSVSTSHTGDLHVDAIACVDARWVWLLPDAADDPPEGLVEWLRSGDDLDISDEDYEQWSDYLDTVQPIPGDKEAIVLWMVGPDVGSLAIDGTVNWEGAHACHTAITD